MTMQGHGAPSFRGQEDGASLRAPRRELSAPVMMRQGWFLDLE
jgi:hypothetical protein